MVAAKKDIPGLVYAGVFIATCGKDISSPGHFLVVLSTGKTLLINPLTGTYPAFPGNVTWLSNNLAGGYKRATGMAIQIGLGSFSGGKVPVIPANTCTYWTHY